MKKNHPGMDRQRRRWLQAASGLALAAVGTLVACGGSTSRIDPFYAQRLVVFGDEYSLLDDSDSTGNAHHYGINALDSSDTTNAIKQGAEFGIVGMSSNCQRAFDVCH